MGNRYRIEISTSGAVELYRYYPRPSAIYNKWYHITGFAGERAERLCQEATQADERFNDRKEGQINEECRFC